MGYLVRLSPSASFLAPQKVARHPIGWAERCEAMNPPGFRHWPLARSGLSFSHPQWPARCKLAQERLTAGYTVGCRCCCSVRPIRRTRMLIPATTGMLHGGQRHPSSSLHPSDSTQRTRGEPLNGWCNYASETSSTECCSSSPWGLRLSLARARLRTRSCS